jgi:hypothetical protein
MDLFCIEPTRRGSPRMIRKPAHDSYVLVRGNLAVRYRVGYLVHPRSEYGHVVSTMFLGFICCLFGHCGVRTYSEGGIEIIPYNYGAESMYVDRTATIAFSSDSRGHRMHRMLRARLE